MNNSKFNTESINLPTVSVIVPTFNRPHMLINALNSIMDQSYKNYEIIVVNDGGEDVTEIINQIPCSNITYISHPENRGMAAARNTALKIAKGKYIAYLDDDDIYYSNHLEILVNFLEKNDYKVAYTDPYVVYQSNNNGLYETIDKGLIFTCDFDRDRLLYNNYITTLCIMHELSCIDRVGMFDESFNVCEDWDLWIRLARNYDFYHINKFTCEFYRRSDSSNITHKRSDMARARLKLFKKYKKYVLGKPFLVKEQRYLKKKAIKNIIKLDHYLLYILLKYAKNILKKIYQYSYNSIYGR